MVQIYLSIKIKYIASPDLTLKCEISKSKQVIRAK